MSGPFIAFKLMRDVLSFISFLLFFLYHFISTFFFSQCEKCPRLQMLQMSVY